MDIASMVVAFANNISGVAWKLLWSLAALVGLLYSGSSIARMARGSAHPYGRHQVNGTSTVAALVIGSCLVNLSKVIGKAWNSLHPSVVTYGPISYGGATATFGKLAPAINAVLTLASIAGGYFAFKGFILWKRAYSDGQSSMGGEDHVWRAFTHIIFGACLVQIPVMIDAFRESLGLMW